MKLWHYLFFYIKLRLFDDTNIMDFFVNTLKQFLKKIVKVWDILSYCKVGLISNTLDIWTTFNNYSKKINK